MENDFEYVDNPWDKKPGWGGGSKFFTYLIVLTIICGMGWGGYRIYLGAFKAPVVINTAHRRVDVLMLELYNEIREGQRKEFDKEVVQMNQDEERDNSNTRWYVKKYGLPKQNELPTPPEIFEFVDDNGTACLIEDIKWSNNPHKPRIQSCRIIKPFSYNFTK
jgi:hypothetical protein